MSIPDSVVTNLKHQFLVIRKEAIDELVGTLKDNPSNLKNIQDFVFTLLNENTWQSKQSAFLLSQRLMDHSDKTFQSKVLKMAQEYFEFSEHRVREAVADCMGDLARVGGLEIYKSVKEQLFKLIKDNFTRPETDASGPQSLAKIEASKKEKEKETEKKSNSDESKDNEKNKGNGTIATSNGVNGTVSNNSKNKSNDKNEKGGDEKKDENSTLNSNANSPQNMNGRKIIAKPTSQHDSEGWKCLWSAMKTIERMVVGLGTKFEPEIDENLLELLQKATLHINRFVREVTYQTYAGICHALSKDNLKKLRVCNIRI